MLASRHVYRVVSPFTLLVTDPERVIEAIVVRLQTGVGRWSLSASGIDIVSHVGGEFQTDIIVDMRAREMPAAFLNRRFRELYLSVPCVNEATVFIVYAAPAANSGGAVDP